MNRILQAARETMAPQTILPGPVPGVQEFDILQAQEQGLETALEVFRQRAATLENIVEAIKNVPESKATPELMAVVQATLLTDDYEDPVLSLEREGVAGSWDKTKGFAGKTLATLQAAAKEGIKQLLELLDKILNFVITTRKGVERKLGELRRGLSSAPQVTEIQYNRNFLPLTLNGVFDGRTAAQVQQRYATVLAASVYAVDEVFDNTQKLLQPSYKPGALGNMGEHFISRTDSAFNWNDNVGKVFEGEGGMNATVTVRSNRLSVDIDTANVDAEVKTTANSFSRSEIDLLLKQGMTLLDAVSKLEPKIDKVRSSLRRAFAADIGLKLLTDGKSGYHARGHSATALFIQMRSFVNFASTYGVGGALKGARAAAVLGDAFMKGTIVSVGDDTGTMATGNIDNKRLAGA